MDREPQSPVEEVFAELRRRLPSVTVQRLEVTHPADDDNVWFITADASGEVQIGTHPDGLPPFLIEGDLPEQRQQTDDVGESVDLILTWLGRS